MPPLPAAGTAPQTSTQGHTEGTVGLQGQRRNHCGSSTNLPRLRWPHAEPLTHGAGRGGGSVRYPEDVGQGCSPHGLCPHSAPEPVSIATEPSCEIARKEVNSGVRSGLLLSLSFLPLYLEGLSPPGMIYPGGQQFQKHPERARAFSWAGRTQDPQAVPPSCMG